MVSYQQEYVLRDHLGNTRVTFTDADNNGIVSASDIKQINNFYPFGLNMEGNWNGAAGNNKYQYNGKEWNDDFGLGWNDYGARWYAPDAPRWTTIDPLSESYKRWSPYNYGADNPVKFFDPNGMSVETDYYNTNGKLVKHEEDGKSDKKIVLTDSKKEDKVNEAINEGSVIDVPSNEVVKQMENAFDATDKTGNEHGFYVGNEGKTSITVEGTEGEVSNKEWKVARDDLRSKGDLISYDVHTHPLKKDEDGNITSKGLPEPSSTDKNNIVGNKPNVVLGYDVINIPPPAGTVGGSYTQKPVRQIGFYNANGNINKNTIDFNNFKGTVNKINKQK